jgi:hypothetical protein
MKDIKELTVEDFIAKEKEMHEKKKEIALANLKKIEERAAVAKGEEKVRLKSLVTLHTNNKLSLDSVTDEELERIAKDKFDKEKGKKENK